MALQKFYDNIFASLRAGVTSDEERIVYSAWVQQLEADEQAAREYAQKLVDWYNRDTAQVREHIRLTGNVLFKNSNALKLLPVLNAVPRIVKRISLAYVQPPVRRIFDGASKEHVAGSAVWDAVYGPEGMYKNVDVEKMYKLMDRWSTLLNTLHVEVVPRGDAIDWDFHLRPSTTVLVDPGDYLQFVKLAYRYCPIDPDTLKPRFGWVYWSKDIHAYRLDNGEWHGVSIMDGDAEGDNPYDGEMPIVTVRKIEQDDYWGSYGADLVEGVEQCHVQMANMWFNALMQSHGQPVGVNLNLPLGQNLVVGPDNPLLIDKVTKDDVEPSLTFAKPDSEVTSVRELVEWFIKEVGQGYGLPPGAWSLDEVPESGFAKFMNNIELLEDRDDSRAMWAKVEQELFTKSVMVYNRWAKEQAHKRLPEGLRLEVEYPPVQFPESPTEIATRYMLAIKAGISSPVRYFMEQEGLDENDAKAKAIKVREETQEVENSTLAEEAKRFNAFAMPKAPGSDSGGGGDE